MYLVSPTSEGIYIKKRFNTIKAALQEGCRCYCCNNYCCFSIIAIFDFASIDIIVVVFVISVDFCFVTIIILFVDIDVIVVVVFKCAI